MRVAQARPEPIPIFAEMSSINPVILLPHALADNGAAIATQFIASLTLGAGQFCTNPRLIPAIGGEGLDGFLNTARDAISAAPAMTMLTPGIRQAYENSIAALQTYPEVETLARGLPGGGNQGQAGLFVASGKAFIANRKLHDEIFGAAALIVRCANIEELMQAVRVLEGQLTAAIHLAEEDYAIAKQLMMLLERKVGRILLNGFGVGVEVSHAMMHGGPFPSTSVGSLAIRLFLRPVCYQNFPQDLLPPALKWGNPFRLHRLINGICEKM